MILIHKIKLVEVREKDMYSELSVLRGLSNSSGEAPSFDNITLNYDSQVNLCGYDNEPEIVFDARMISEIDSSRATLSKISKRITDAKKELLDIDTQMEDVSSIPKPKDLNTSSAIEMELYSINDSSRVELTQELSLSSSSRVGDARKTSPTYTTTDMSQEQEKNLLSQEELGYPRDRHGGEPDAAGSTVLGRESCEGTTGAASVSAPIAKAATAEVQEGNPLCDCDLQEGLVQMDVASLPITGEKRKASLSPSTQIEDLGVRRHTKTRIVETVEIENHNDPRNLEEHETYLDREKALSMDCSSSSNENRGITEKSFRKLNNTGDFSASRASRREELDRNLQAKEHDTEVDTRFGDADLVVRVERLIGPIVERINKENSDDPVEMGYVSSSKSSRSQRHRKTKGKRYDTDSEDNNITDDYQEESKVSKAKLNAKKDKSVKNSTPKVRRKSSYSEIVSKGETEKELGFSREDWLRMDGTDLGSRCLDYLDELDRQRKLSGNLSGQVVGRMKDSKQVAVEITKALIEKITTVGDVHSLRNANFSLKEEINELKRKEQTHVKEITSLRKTISNLEREVRAMKEGFSSFSKAMSPPSLRRTLKKQRTPGKRLKETKDSGNRSKRQFNDIRMDMDMAMEVDSLSSGTPGCSTDLVYMQRKDERSGGENFANCPNRMIYEDVEATNKTVKGDINYADTAANLACSDAVYGNANIIDKPSLRSNLRPNIKFDDKYDSRTVGPRIVEIRQLVPPSRPSDSPSNVGHRMGKRGRVMSDGGVTGGRVISAVAPAPEIKKRVIDSSDSVSKSRRRLTKPAVVTITGRPGGASYAQILAKAREKVSLSELGIQDTVIRRAMNGAIVIEVPGPQGKQLASRLSDNLAEVLGEEARVLNPVAMAELRLRGLDPSTTMEEIHFELERLSGCSRRDLRVSPINNMRDGMGVAWVNCPLDIAVKIAEIGVVTMGWTKVKIELLKKRPVQCFRCWKFGHVRTSCRSEIDRQGTCFRCGLAGHMAGHCNAPAPRCVICEDLGQNSRHRIGSPRCLDNQGLPSGVQAVRRIQSSAAGRSVFVSEAK